MRVTGLGRTSGEVGVWAGTSSCRPAAWHSTSERGSWLHMAAREWSVRAGPCWGRRIPDLEALRREGAAREQKRNAAVVTEDWQFTTSDARVKLKRLDLPIELQ